MLALLRHRDFGLLWTGGLVSVAGDWVLRAALPFFVYERTGSTIATAGMIAAELAPAVLLGSVAGVFVDRWDRKRVLVVSNLLEAAAVALLLLVPHGGPLWVVYAVAAVQSTVAAFGTPAETALLPTLVGRDDLLAANALNSLNNRVGRLLGLPLGGALLGYLGLEAVVLVDCASFLGAALLIAPIRAPRRRHAPDGDVAAAASAWASFWHEWLDGLRLVRRERTIAVLFFVFGLMTFGGTMFDPLTVAWVRDVLGRGPQVYSGLMTVHAVAGIGGSLLVARLGRRLTPRELMGWGSIAAAAALFVKFNVPVLSLAIALSAVGGVTSVASAVGAETVAQQSVSDEYRGRVFGSLGATLSLLSLAGAFVGGALGEVVGTVPMLNVAAGLTALAGVVVLRALRRDRLPGVAMSSRVARRP